MPESEKTMKLLPMLREEKGIALVTSLMLTLLSLTIVVTAMYLLNISTKQSGLTKRYKTAVQASYGGSDVILKDLIPLILRNVDNIQGAGSNGPAILQIFQQIANNYAGTPQLPGITDLQFAPGYATTDAALCLQMKLSSTPQNWTLPDGVSCSSTLKAKDMPDFQFTVPAVSGATPYTVYSKIVDTKVGNSDMSGVSLLGSGVADGQNAIIPQHIPYVFRVEVQAERTVNATETASLSVLYSY